MDARTSVVRRLAAARSPARDPLLEGETMHETFRIEIDGVQGAPALADALERALRDRGLGVDRVDRDGVLALVVEPGQGRAGSAPDVAPDTAPEALIALRIEAGGSELHLTMDRDPETLVLRWSGGAADAGDLSSMRSPVLSPILHALERAGRIPREHGGRLSPEQERMLLLRLEKLGYL